ncbi:MAG: four helix bundle protein [Gemmatimonadota bacterium]|nr:four helix bundle protein [Gemmatimonadota bacterium]
MSDFKKLQVWQKAHALSLTIDRMCKRMRGSQYASLRSQTFRAAMSIPANIAEGRCKNSDKDFARFLGYALSSCSELEYHLIVARDTKVIPESDFVSSISQTITVRKMLYGLLNCLSVAQDSKAKGTTVGESPQPSAGPPTAASR